MVWDQYSKADKFRHILKEICKDGRQDLRLTSTKGEEIEWQAFQIRIVIINCHIRLSGSGLTHTACLPQHPLKTPSCSQRSPSIRVLHEKSFELLEIVVCFPDCAIQHAAHATY